MTVEEVLRGAQDYLVAVDGAERAQVNALMAILEERAVLGEGTESSSEWRVSVVGDGESGV